MALLLSPEPRGEAAPWRPEAHSPYVRGRHLEDFGGGAAPARCRAGAVLLDRPPPGRPEALALRRVPGARLLRRLCSAAECGQLLLLAEAAGLEGAPEGGALRASFFVDAQLNQCLFERVRSLLPQECLGGLLVGLDQLWVVERCLAGAHGPPSRHNAAHENCQARGHVTEDLGEVPRATLLLFLNHGVRGGEVRFWIPDQRLETFVQQAVPPEQGSALFFFHDDHPLSVIHEDAPVLGISRHVLKCHVMYQRHANPGETEEFKQCVNDYPNIYHGRKWWERWSSHLVARGAAAPPPPLELGPPPGGLMPATFEGVNGQTEFTVGELVEAFWDPERRFFKARVREIKDDSTIVVNWTDWEGIVALPASKVRRCTTVSSRPPQAEAEWVTID